MARPNPFVGKAIFGMRLARGLTFSPLPAEWSETNRAPAHPMSKGRGGANKTHVTACCSILWLPIDSR